jgi:hypothetical protein
MLSLKRKAPEITTTRKKGLLLDTKEGRDWFLSKSRTTHKQPKCWEGRKKPETLRQSERKQKEEELKKQEEELEEAVNEAFKDLDWEIDQYGTQFEEVKREEKEEGRKILAQLLKLDGLTLPKQHTYLQMTCPYCGLGYEPGNYSRHKFACKGTEGNDHYEMVMADILERQPINRPTPVDREAFHQLDPIERLEEEPQEPCKTEKCLCGVKIDPDIQLLCGRCIKKRYSVQKKRPRRWWMR